MMWLGLGLAGSLALGGTWAVTSRARGFLAARGVLDVPNHRSSHDRVVPSGGGVGIVAVCCLVAATGWIVLGQAGLALVVTLLGAVALAGLGFVDDRIGAGVLVRLSAQGVVAGVVAGVAVAVVDLSGPVMGLLWLAATLLLVGATNIFNFMDGIDGIAAVTAATFGVLAVGLAVIADLSDLAVLAAALTGACLGFLIHNWHPASIFMGDSGSLFLGFLAAGLPLAVAGDDPRALALLGVLLPFLVDGLLTIARRWRRGEPLTEAHRDHVYQRAARRVGHATVAASYGAAALAAGAVTVGLALVSLSFGAAGLLSTGMALTVLWWLVSRHLDATT